MQGRSGLPTQGSFIDLDTARHLSDLIEWADIKTIDDELYSQFKDKFRCDMSLWNDIEKRKSIGFLTDALERLNTHKRNIQQHLQSITLADYADFNYELTKVILQQRIDELDSLIRQYEESLLERNLTLNAVPSLAPIWKHILKHPLGEQIKHSFAEAYYILLNEKIRTELSLHDMREVLKLYGQMGVDYSAGQVLMELINAEVCLRLEASVLSPLDATFIDIAVYCKQHMPAVWCDLKAVLEQQLSKLVPGLSLTVLLDLLHKYKTAGLYLAGMEFINAEIFQRLEALTSSPADPALIAIAVYFQQHLPTSWSALKKVLEQQVAKLAPGLSLTDILDLLNKYKNAGLYLAGHDESLFTLINQEICLRVSHDQIDINDRDFQALLGFLAEHAHQAHARLQQTLATYLSTLRRDVEKNYLALFKGQKKAYKANFLANKDHIENDSEFIQLVQRHIAQYPNGKAAEAWRLAHQYYGNCTDNNKDFFLEMHKWALKHGSAFAYSKLMKNSADQLSDEEFLRAKQDLSRRTGQMCSVLASDRDDRKFK